MTARAACRRGRPRPIDRGVPGLPQLRQEQAQRPLEDGTHVAIGHAVPKQILSLAQPLVRLARDGELDFVALGRERPDLHDVRSALGLTAARSRPSVAIDIAGTVRGLLRRLVTGTAIVAAAFDAGSFRTDDGTAGSGRSAATSSSISRLVLCRAAASTRS